jgi:hypothetical protein
MHPLSSPPTELCGRGTGVNSGFFQPEAMAYCFERISIRVNIEFLKIHIYFSVNL